MNTVERNQRHGSWHYAQVVLKELVKTDFKLRYQGSFLGIAWSVVKPLMLFCIMYVVFVRFLRFTDGTPHYPLVLLLGIGLWNFFAEATSVGLMSIVGRGDLLRKIHFPSMIVVISASISALISLGINLVVVIVFCLFSRVQFTFRVLLVPLSILQFYMFALGIALLLATGYVYFRDVAHLWDVLLQAGFYATPILYPLSMVRDISPLAAKVMLLNPVAQIVQDIRYNLIAPGTTPTVWSEVNTPGIRVIPIILTLVVLLLGIAVFDRYSRRFAESL